MSGSYGGGKTYRVLSNFRNSLPGAPADARFDKMAGRRPVPIYSGRMTAAKGFVRAWIHRDEPLVVFNDVSIDDKAWEAFHLQLLEDPGERTLRWDTRTPLELGEADRAEIAAIRRARAGRSDAAGAGDAGDATPEVPEAVPHSFTCRSTYIIVANRLGPGD